MFDTTVHANSGLQLSSLSRITLKDFIGHHKKAKMTIIINSQTDIKSEIGHLRRRSRPSSFCAHEQKLHLHYDDLFMEIMAHPALYLPRRQRAV